MTTDGERTHEELARETRLLDLKYFWLNVQYGLENINFAECDKFAEIATQTTPYLESFDVGNTMAYCALHLKPGYDLDLYASLTNVTLVEQVHLTKPTIRQWMSHSNFRYATNPFVTS
jgi:hypothetical protein